MKEQEIHDICKKYDIRNYIINPDGSIDVMDNVDLHNLGLTNLPFKFNKVSGYFYCNNNNLTSLEGCPNYVGGWFSCSNNNLTSLEGSPNYVGGSFSCSGNKLTSLDGYNGEYDKLYCHNKQKLVRKNKLKIIEKI